MLPLMSVCVLTEESCILHDGLIVIPEMMFNEVAKEKLCSFTLLSSMQIYKSIRTSALEPFIDQKIN